MSETVAYEDNTHRYSVAAVVALALVFVAAPLSWLGLHSEASIIRAPALLLVPASVLAWLFYTVKALHTLELRFWRLSSTYASIIFGMVALIFGWIGVAGLSNDHVNPSDPTFFIAASIIVALCVAGCARYNWKATGHVLLTVSLTAVQVVTMITVVWFLVYLFLRLNHGGKVESVS